MASAEQESKAPGTGLLDSNSNGANLTNYGMALYEGRSGFVA